MPIRDWFRPPRSLLTLYLTGAAMTVACLGWMAVRQWHQDAALDAQRNSERLRGAANLAAARALQALAELDRALVDPPMSHATHAQIVTVKGGGFRVIAGRLPYVPDAPASTPVPDGIFDDAERLEVRPTERLRAVAAYRALAASASTGVRAGALVRLARVLRQRQRHEEALRVYAALEALSGVVVEGRPADLIARLGRCAVLERLGRRDELARASAMLRIDLERGRWPISGPLWASISAEAIRWSGGASPASEEVEEDLAAARACEQFWRERDAAPPTGVTRVAVDTARGAALVVARPTSEGTRLLVAAPAHVALLQRSLSDASTRIALRRLDAPRQNGEGSRALTLSTSETGLPWVLVASDADPGRVQAEARARRTVWLAGLSLMGVLILVSGCLTFRGIRREIAMASLQADLVSAVSHEFRTPLTSIRQLSHMLHAGRVSSEERRDQYYAVLVRESERLHRLVERMLGIGRADAGRFRFEALNAGALARRVVSDFASQGTAARITVDVSDDACAIRGDREMLSLAVWNLLDNAVKYSGGDAPVQVDVRAHDGRAAIAVTDRGIGIAPRDRARIFEKFTRGSSEIVWAVAGSGLGLAFVDRVVRAHGGTVEVTSEPGRGSTFTLLIPQEAGGAPSRQALQAEEVQS